MPARRVTIRNVAARSGVSISTASRALNGKGRLTADTRRRVILAVGARTYTIGMITSDKFGRLCSPVMLGAEDALGASRISAFRCDSGDDSEQERQHVELLLGRAVDGLIMIGHRIEPRPSVSAGLGIPVVYAVAQSVDGSEPAVIPDDVGGGRAAAAHLISAGRRRLAHITGPGDFLAARRRASGFGEEAAAAGVDLRPEHVVFGEWSEKWGREAARGILRGTPDVDGFFCGNDQIARGASDALREVGRRIPADAAVVGFDNWDPVVLGADPPLTSVDMGLEGIGRKAAGLLLRAVGGEHPSGVHTVPGRLVQRDSSGPG